MFYCYDMEFLWHEMFSGSYPASISQHSLTSETSPSFQTSGYSREEEKLESVATSVLPIRE